MRIALAFVVFMGFGLMGALSAASFPKTYVKAYKGQLVQGGLVILTLAPDTKLQLNNKNVPQINNLALIGFGRDAPLTQKIMFMRDGKTQRLNLTLKKRDYNIQRINGLPPALVSPPPEALPLIRQQSQQKYAARQDNIAASWFAENFSWPVKGRITGVYGSQRFYNGQPRRPHFGVDIAAPTGTPVYAPASGVVSLAAPDMYFEGGLVFVDHGLRLVSVLMHLNRIDVQLGDFVKAGQQIGTVGATGRATGPHLDWRMYWADQRVDPSLLVPSPKNGTIQ